MFGKARYCSYIHVMNKDAVKKIVDSIYPKVQQFYGLSKFNSKTPKVKYHHNIYARITGIAEAEGECSPAAEFERETNTICDDRP